MLGEIQNENIFPLANAEKKGKGQPRTYKLVLVDGKRKREWVQRMEGRKDTWCIM